MGEEATPKAKYERCSWCARTGTLTSLSMGNRCVLEDDCHEARHELVERMKVVAAGPVQEKNP